jgi:hypothetical protein
MTIQARVQDGRLIVDEPTNVPEGTEVRLLPLDPSDWLDDEDRAALHEALAQSEADVKAGRLFDAAEVLKGLRPQFGVHTEGTAPRSKHSPSISLV